MNLPLHFTNSILQDELPHPVQNSLDKVKIDSKFIEFCQHRINWCLHHDTALRRLPKNREFPYLDQSPPRVYGVTTNRKENHLLQTLYDISQMWISKQYGINLKIIKQRYTSPNCILPLNRDNKFVILDLECDFITMLSSVNNETLNEVVAFDSNFMINTSKKELQSIHPLSWEVSFNTKNFYNNDYEFMVPPNSTIHSIFLSNNDVRNLTDKDFQGRAIMFCYGYAVQQAKLKHKMDDIEKIDLEKPICVQCVFTNPDNFKVGFVLFQLNTLRFNDTNVRNQVWLMEPKSVTDEIEQMMTNLVGTQSIGLYN